MPFSLIFFRHLYYLYAIFCAIDCCFHYFDFLIIIDAIMPPLPLIRHFHIIAIFYFRYCLTLRLRFAMLFADITPYASFIAC